MGMLMHVLLIALQQESPGREQYGPDTWQMEWLEEGNAI